MRGRATTRGEGRVVRRRASHPLPVLADPNGPVRDLAREVLDATGGLGPLGAVEHGLAQPERLRGDLD